MGWVWSDELANTLKESPETAQLVPQGWIARPCAFSAAPDEDLQMAGRRLLGLASANAPEPATAAETTDTKPTCTCR